MTRAYRPANGTEGEAFEAKFCRRCACDDEAAVMEKGEGCCPILADALAGGQPSQWVQNIPGIDGPTCRAFVERRPGEPVLNPYRAAQDRARFDALPQDPASGRPVI